MNERTRVSVDWSICKGHGICIDICPVTLFDWKDTSENPGPRRKAFPTRESECIACMACEVQCPVGAISIN